MGVTSLSRIIFRTYFMSSKGFWMANKFSYTGLNRCPRNYLERHLHQMSYSNTSTLYEHPPLCVFIVKSIHNTVS